MSKRRHPHDDRHMTLQDHVREIVTRMSLALVLLLVASSLVYVYRSAIIPVILEPARTAFGDQKLMYLNPAGGFNFIFLVSIYIGLAFVTPFIVQQLYAFIRPILPKEARRLSFALICSSGVLLMAGVLFGYLIAVPAALTFLQDFASGYVRASLTADSYLNFLIAYTVGLGLLFQLPIILVIGNYIKPFTPRGLWRGERWAIVLIMIAAAIITPTPDPLNMMIVALPILLMYQLGVIAVLFTNARKKRQDFKGREVARPRTTVSPIKVLPVPVATSVIRITPVEVDVPTRKSINDVMSSPTVGLEYPRPLVVAPRPVSKLGAGKDGAARSLRTQKRYLDGISVVG